MSLSRLLMLLGPILVQFLTRLGLKQDSQATKDAIKKAKEDGDTSDLEDDFRSGGA